MQFPRLSTAVAAAAAKTLNTPQSVRKIKRSCDPDEALKIYNTENLFSYSSTAVRSAQEHTVRLLAKSGRYTEIETFLESHKSSSQITQEYFLFSLIHSYGTARMFQNALQTYDEMSELGTPRSALSFNALLRACIDSELFDRVITYFDELPAKFGFSPNNVSYSILIQSHCKLGSPEIAIRKCNEMREKGFELDSLDFTTILHSFYVNGRITEAERFWDEMVKEKGFKPGVRAFSVKLSQVQHGDIDGFNRSVEEMINAEVLPDAEIYNIIIKFYCENGMMDAAKMAYDQMLSQKGCCLVPSTCRTLVIHYYKIGEFLSAYEVFENSPQYHMILDFDMVKSLVVRLAKRGHEDEAKNMIRKMKDRSPKLLEAWCQLADSLGLNEYLHSDKIVKGVHSRGTVKTSQPTWDQLAESHRLNEDLFWDYIVTGVYSSGTVKPSQPTKSTEVVDNQTVKKLRQVRDPDEAIQIYNSFISKHDPTFSSRSACNAQQITVCLLAKFDRFSDIETLLESAKFSPHITQERYVSSLIRSYGTVGMFENALETYEQMTEFGTPRSTVSFKALLLPCVQFQLFHRVIIYFDEFPTKFGFSPDKFCYGMLIKSYCEMQSPEIAMEKFKEMKDRGLKADSYVFNTIFRSLHAMERSQEAEIFWDEMVKEKGIKPDSFSYSLKLNTVQHGDVERFKRLNEEMNNAGILTDAITCNIMITFYCENGMMDEAKKLFDKMLMQKGCDPISQTFSTLVFHNCTIGEFLSAYEVFKESVKHHKIPYFSNLKCLTEGLAKTGHKKEAKALIETMKTLSPPDLLGAWEKLAEAVGLCPNETQDGYLAHDDGTEEVDHAEAIGLCPNETQDGNLVHDDGAEEADHAEAIGLCPNETQDGNLAHDDGTEEVDHDQWCHLASALSAIAKGHSFPGASKPKVPKTRTRFCKG